MSTPPSALHNEFPPGSIEAKDLEHLLHPTTNLKQHAATGPAVHVEAKGVYLWDNQGNQYLEGMAGLWCTAIGYGNEELAEVAAAEMKKLSYSQLFGGCHLRQFFIVTGRRHNHATSTQDRLRNKRRNSFWAFS